MARTLYENENVKLILGDARTVLPRIERYDTLITDPVWPNSTADIMGADRPRELFQEMWQALSTLPARAAIQLGCNSDPRFLVCVPPQLAFFRYVSLEISRKAYHGRLLHSGDVAMLFGKPPMSRPGLRVIPGRCNDEGGKDKEAPEHPCPRKLKHVKYLVHIWTDPDDTVIDPFCGSGTTLIAALELGRKAIGIEIEPRWGKLAQERLVAWHAQRRFVYET